MMIDHMIEPVSFGVWRLTILETGGPFRVYVDNAMVLETSDADDQDSFLIEYLSEFQPRIEIIPLDEIDAGYIPDGDYFGPFAQIQVRTPRPDLLPDLPEFKIIADAEGYLIIGSDETLEEGPIPIDIGINAINTTGSVRVAIRPETPQARVNYNHQSGVVAINAIESPDSF
jgi:hypothetical protein